VYLLRLWCYTHGLVSVAALSISLACSAQLRFRRAWHCGAEWLWLGSRTRRHRGLSGDDSASLCCFCQPVLMWLSCCLSVVTSWGVVRLRAVTCSVFPCLIAMMPDGVGSAGATRSYWHQLCRATAGLGRLVGSGAGGWPVWSISGSTISPTLPCATGMARPESAWGRWGV